MARAWGQVARWLDSSVACIPKPTEQNRAVLGSLLAGGAQSNMAPDAHLAALAIEHGLVLCSSDSDFARPNLRWDNPLAEPSRRR
jgi:uncharacterized protein